MTQFTKYMHIERYPSAETDSISLGKVYVFPKLDGTNASLWVEPGEDGELYLKGGSRNRVLTEQCDNQGFYTYALAQPQYLEYLRKHPTHIIYGEYLCLSGDTVIRKASGGKGGKGNYMTISEMYNYRHKKEREVSKYWLNKTGEIRYVERSTSWWERYGMPSIYSLDSDTDKVHPMKMKDIIYSGIKPVYELTTRKGYKIKATKEHPFFTPNGYVPLGELKINDCVAVVSYTKYKAHRNYGKGSNQIKIRQTKYIKEKGCCERCGSTVGLELHHKDQNWRNNDPSNWECLCRDCHKMAHHTIHMDNNYDYEFDKIVSIEYVGEEDCYDISMDESVGEPNFVANNFIVHNCPHTIKDYDIHAWKKLYVFDVLDTETGQFIPYEEYRDLLTPYGFNIIPPLAVGVNLSLRDEDIQEYLKNNHYLMIDEEHLGEGIVIKNYGYTNPFGKTIWGKVVRPTFKSQSKAKYKGGVPTVLEDEIIQKYLTEEAVTHEVLKFKDEYGEITGKTYGKLLGLVWRGWMQDNIWNIIKLAGKRDINFSVLRKKVENVIKLYYPI